MLACRADTPGVPQEKREALERLQRMEYFESQDFDPVENDVERAAELARDQADYAAEENWRWLLSGASSSQLADCLHCCVKCRLTEGAALQC